MINLQFSIFNKKLLTIVIIFLFSISQMVFAQSSSTLQKAVEQTEESVEVLATVKDSQFENPVLDLAFRIETFQKVIALSISEAKSLKLKILNLESSDDLNENYYLWLKDMINQLNQVLDYYEEQLQVLENNEPITLDIIKQLAQDFKDWRQSNYLPFANQIVDFLLINQEKKAISVAQKRFQKISTDIYKLQKAELKGVSTLIVMLNKADDFIRESIIINQEAELLFNNLHIEPFLLILSSLNATTTTTTDTTNITATSTIINNFDATTTVTSTTSTPDSDSTSTIELAEDQVLSIKDLIRNSLSQIREAYRIFIEMSSLVRELLD